MAGRVEGKVAFITGAGRGQGRSHAVRLAQEGADIIAVDICEDVRDLPASCATEEDLAETVRLVEELDRRIIARKVDVRDYDRLVDVLAEGVGEFGRLDIVASNAGVGSYAYPAHEIPEHVWQDVLDINLTGSWHACKAAIPHVLAGGRGGSMVLTASCAGLEAYRNIAHYNVSKHGVIGLMRTLANEYGPQWIRVNCICPTFTNTKIVMNDATYKLFRPDLENPTADDLAEVSGAMNILPVPWLEPIDHSNALLFLASDEARHVTGVAFPVDAGTLIKT